MHLRQINIRDFRNLKSLELEVSPQFNLFYGQNASGKTSFLEAIYYLAMGRSFRAHLSSRIMHYEAACFSLFGEFVGPNNNLRTPVGIERHRNGEGRIRLANENIRSIVAITQILPLQLLNPDSRLLLSSGPKLRRRFMDWGVFHVEPLFYVQWQYAQRALKQRNAALRSSGPNVSAIQAWDNELCLAAERLDMMRSVFVACLGPLLHQLLNSLDFPEEITLIYRRGWEKESELRTVLAQALSRDLQLGYTQFGPQRADLIPMIANKRIPAHEVLSQGQQKLLVYALHLAQGLLLFQQTGKSCIYLLDDLAAELDDIRRSKMLTVLSELDAQVFITGIRPDDFCNFSQLGTASMFHVKHGNIYGV